MTFFYFSLFFISGTYVCAKCEFELFGSESKYGHHTPWPAFHATKHPNSLSKKMQDKYTFKVRQGIDAHLFYLTFVRIVEIDDTIRFYLLKSCEIVLLRIFFFPFFFYFLLQEFMFVWSVIILCFPHMPNTSIKPRGPPFPNPFEMIA